MSEEGAGDRNDGIGWQPAGAFAIRTEDGRHYIAKLLVGGVPGYLLFPDGRLLRGRSFDSARAAVEHLRELNGGRNTVEPAAGPG